MGSRTVIRFRQSRQGSADPAQISLAAIEDAVQRSMVGTFGPTSATAAVVQLRRPWRYNLISLVIDTDRPVTSANRRIFAEQANRGVNSAGFGTWTLPAVLSPIYHTEPHDTSGASSPAAGRGVLQGQVTTVQTSKPPPPRWSSPPLFGLDLTLQGATVNSKEPARSNVTPKAADAAAPPESPPNDWTLGGVVPVLIVAGAVILTGGLIYYTVAK